MRRYKWIKQDTLDYPLTDLNKAIQELNEIGFIENDLKDIEAALHVLTKPELKNIAKERHIDMQETVKMTCTYAYVYNSCAYLYLEKEWVYKGDSKIRLVRSY